MRLRTFVEAGAERAVSMSRRPVCYFSVTVILHFGIQAVVITRKTELKALVRVPESSWRLFRKHDMSA